jgi:predicted transcriptional regulator
MNMVMSKSSPSDILKAISEEKTSALFNAIAIETSNSHDLIIKLKLSRRQYYSRLYALMKAGLIKRERSKYYLTSLGKVTYVFYTIVQHAVNNYWKLKAIDSLEISTGKITKEERINLINALIDNDRLKRILVDMF